MTYSRYFEAGGITIRFDSDLPIAAGTLASKFKLFARSGPGRDNVHLAHRFFLPDRNRDFGRLVYRRPPWMIYQGDKQWVYVLGASRGPDDPAVRQLNFASLDHSEMEIFNGDLLKSVYEGGNLDSLTMAPTDQVFLARLLAERSGCYIHSDGVSMEGKGYLFVGHSGAGKSTIAAQLRDRCEILCDDRMIVRKWDRKFFIHGNWSHGTLPIVSAGAAPLEGIFFLEQAGENRIIPEADRLDSISRLLGCLVRPLATKDWWEKMLTLVEDLASSVPCYRLRFDKSGDIYHELRAL